MKQYIIAITHKNSVSDVNLNFYDEFKSELKWFGKGF